MRASAAISISAAPTGNAAQRQPSGNCNAGVLTGICRFMCSMAGVMISATKVQTVSALTASSQPRHFSGKRVTIAVSRICAPRCKASTAPSMASQLNRIDASSSDQISGWFSP